MRKFKHEQTGLIATKEVINYYLNDKFKSAIPKELIENSKDWVEIFESKFKNFDIVEYGSAIVLITDYEKGEGYGISGNTWLVCNWTFKKDPQLWQLSTQKKWLEALTKEVKNNYKTGDKFNSLFSNTECIVTKMHTSWDAEEQILFVDRNCIMYKGVWAKVIKEETLEDFAERFKDYIFTGNTNNLSIAIKTFFNENKETIHRLSK